MPIALNSEPVAPGFYEKALTAYLRFVSMILLFFALGYWAMIIGLPGVAGDRFDLMPEHWQAASATLSVILPVAAIGLWGGFPWGVFVWVIAIIVEYAMFLWFSGFFGTNVSVLAFHAASFVTYLLLRIGGILARRRLQNA